MSENVPQLSSYQPCHPGKHNGQRKSWAYCPWTNILAKATSFCSRTGYQLFTLQCRQCLAPLWLGFHPFHPFPQYSPCISVSSSSKFLRHTSSNSSRATQSAPVSSPRFPTERKDQVQSNKDPAFCHVGLPDGKAGLCNRETGDLAMRAGIVRVFELIEKTMSNIDNQLTLCIGFDSH